ncbi:MAG: preprotein translocase subunit SecE [Chloroflexi bacterium]|nr:MAG: preprotein translocase subunit SecE [Chloroflexota bacterium]
MAVSAARRDQQESRVLSFFRDTVEELRKVVWPTPAELYRYTVVVVVTVVVISAFIGLVDLGLGAFTQRYVYNGIQGATH